MLETLTCNYIVGVDQCMMCFAFSDFLRVAERRGSTNAAAYTREQSFLHIFFPSCHYPL